MTSGPGTSQLLTLGKQAVKGKSKSFNPSIISRSDFERELFGFVRGSLRPLILADYADTENVIFIVADLLQTGPADLCLKKVSECLLVFVIDNPHCHT